MSTREAALRALRSGKGAPKGVILEHGGGSSEKAVAKLRREEQKERALALKNQWTAESSENWKALKQSRVGKWSDAEDEPRASNGLAGASPLVYMLGGVTAAIVVGVVYKIITETKP